MDFISSKRTKKTVNDGPWPMGPCTERKPRGSQSVPALLLFLEASLVIWCNEKLRLFCLLKKKLLPFLYITKRYNVNFIVKL